jgi:hypothetical protein
LGVIGLNLAVAGARHLIHHAVTTVTFNCTFSIVKRDDVGFLIVGDEDEGHRDGYYKQSFTNDVS